MHTLLEDDASCWLNHLKSPFLLGSPLIFPTFSQTFPVLPVVPALFCRAAHVNGVALHRLAEVLEGRAPPVTDEIIHLTWRKHGMMVNPQ